MEHWLYSFAFFHTGESRKVFDLFVCHPDSKDCKVCGKLASLNQSEVVPLPKDQYLPIENWKCMWSQGVYKNTSYENACHDIETVLVFMIKLGTLTEGQVRKE